MKDIQVYMYIHRPSAKLNFSILISLQYNQISISCTFYKKCIFETLVAVPMSYQWPLLHFKVSNTQYAPSRWSFRLHTCIKWISISWASSHFNEQALAKIFMYLWTYKFCENIISYDLINAVRPFVDLMYA